MLSAGLALCLPGTACTSPSGASEQSQAADSEPNSLSEVEARIAQLRGELASDRQKLVAFLSAPEATGAPPLSENAEFRSLAEHLTQIELQLAELEGQQSDLRSSAAGRDAVR